MGVPKIQGFLQRYTTPTTLRESNNPANKPTPSQKWFQLRLKNNLEMVGKSQPSTFVKGPHTHHHTPISNGLKNLFIPIPPAEAPSASTSTGTFKSFI